MDEYKQVKKDLIIGIKIGGAILLVVAIGLGANFFLSKAYPPKSGALNTQISSKLTAQAPGTFFETKRTSNKFMVHPKKISSGNYELHYRYCLDSLCTSATDQVIDSGLTAISGIDAVRHSDGLPFITYRKRLPSSSAQLAVVRCHDLNCNSRSTANLGTNLNPYQISMTLGADGNPLIAYNTYQTMPASLFVLHCLDPYCSTYENNLIVSKNTSGSYYPPLFNPKIAIAGNRLPVISYRDPLEDSIAFAHCYDQACSSSNHFLFDTGHSVRRGFYQDLTIVNGRPLIVYSSQPYGGADWPNEIRVAACKDMSCSNMDIRSILEDTNLPGAISVGLGSDGNPMIAFGKPTGGFYAAKCADKLCSLPVEVNQISDGLAELPSSSGISIESFDGKPLFSIIMNDPSFDHQWLSAIHCFDADCSGPITETNHGTVSTEIIGLFLEIPVILVP